MQLTVSLAAISSHAPSFSHLWVGQLKRTHRQPQCIARQPLAHSAGLTNVGKPSEHRGHAHWQLQRIRKGRVVCQPLRLSDGI